MLWQRLRVKFARGPSFRKRRWRSLWQHQHLHDDYRDSRSNSFYDRDRFGASYGIYREGICCLRRHCQVSYVLFDVGNTRRVTTLRSRLHGGCCAILHRRIFIQLVRIAACVAFDKIRCNMAKSKPEPPKQGQEQNTPAGTKITRPRITRTIYKPIPRFNSGCHNC